MALFERIIDPSQPGECSDSIRDLASSSATALAYSRSACFENPEYSEVTIARLRTQLSSSSVGEEDRARLANILASVASDRFKQYDLPESLEEAKSYASQVADLSSSECWGKSSFIPMMGPALESYSIMLMTEKIQQLEELLSNTPPGTDNYTGHLTELAGWYRTRFNRTDSMSDLKEAIKYSRLELEAAHPDNWNIPFMSLQHFLFRAFEKTNKISYLDESIKAGYAILELKSAQHDHFHMVRNLVGALLTREELLAG